MSATFIAGWVVGLWSGLAVAIIVIWWRSVKGTQDHE